MAMAVPTSWLWAPRRFRGGRIGKERGKHPMKILTMLVLGVAASLGAGREVAITIDDLPRGGDGGPRTLAGVRAMTKHLLKPIGEQKIPVIGFVNEGRQEFGSEGLREILDLW